MRRFLENKLFLATVAVLFGLALAWNLSHRTTLPSFSAPLAFTPDLVTEKLGPTMPPPPWEEVRVALGPTMPPPPWEEVRVASALQCRLHHGKTLFRESTGVLKTDIVCPVA